MSASEMLRALEPSSDPSLRRALPLIADGIAALERIEELQPKALAYIRENGFVFDNIGTEPGNWKHLAFSLYTELCEAQALAAYPLTALREHLEGDDE